MLGGKEAGPGWFPFMVALTIKQGHKESQCSGFIVSPTAIMTAAHCFHGTDATIIGKLGSENRKKGKKVKLKVFVNPKFDKETHKNDISILKTVSGEKLPLSDTAKPIALEGSSVKPSCALAMGWGRNKKGSCTKGKAKLPKILLYHSQEIRKMEKKKIFVKGGKKMKTCKGDSGSPLVEMRNGEYVALGILSTGDKSGKEHFTRIFPQKKFVLKHAKDAKFV